MKKQNKMPVFVLLLTLTLAVGAWQTPSFIDNRTDLAAVSRVSLTEQQAHSLAFATGDSTWKKRWWIEKTARLLRGGEGLGPDDNIEALLKLSEDEIITQMLADPRFGDMVLDFNMYVLGFRADSIRGENGYSHYAFENPNAITSAQAVLKNGDYFKLFEFVGNYYLAPLRAEPEEGEGADMAKWRRKLVGEIQSSLKEVIQYGRSRPTPSGVAFCQKIAQANQKIVESSGWASAAFDVALVAFERTSVLPEDLDEPDCNTPAQVNVKLVAEGLQELLDIFNRAFNEILKYEPTLYNPKTVLEFKPFNLTTLPESENGKWMSFSNEQAVALANSSTNFNRKRGAYFLKRFFCDDLTPVGFESPGEHTGGAHGSDTSCYACHYKLDPMAGFFRAFGGNFADYTNSPTVTFDDEVEVQRATYDLNWKAPTGAARQWNVGYVRSPNPKWESKNSYGENLADLSKILRTAPEVKQCLMRRLFEYLIAEKQTIDGGFLDSLTKQFENDAATNSTLALKNSITRLLKSNTYNEGNLDPQKCYDFGPNGPNPNSPPCRVDFVLQQNCAQCHSSTTGAGNLDLSSWILSPDGKNYTFPHLDNNDQQLSAKETFAKVVDRLSTTDDRRRMPRGKPMPSQDRQELFLWAQKYLEGL